MINVSPGENADLEGWVQYENEGPILFRAWRIADTSYVVSVRWGASSWQRSPKIWNIGGRPDQKIIYLHAVMFGEKLTGTAQYENEGPIGFRS